MTSRLMRTSASIEYLVDMTNEKRSCDETKIVSNKQETGKNANI